MTFRFCFIVTTLILFAAAGCRTADSYTYDLTVKDSGRTLALESGDTVRVVLNSNPSTGFFWNEERKPDSDVIRLFSKRFISSGKEKNISGAPGVQEFLYKAAGAGETGISLSYKRPWEQRPPASTFQLRIVIKPDISFLDKLDRSKEPLKRVDSKGRVAPPLPERRYQ